MCQHKREFYMCTNLYYTSGNVIPSQQDMNFTKRIQKCGEMMGITVLDHLIIGRKRYFSLREEGMMEEK
ncbi:DNA repair protein [Enterococcus faecium]|nr:DNA repair protein [Enterococcus faecium]EGP4985522.1 DNA repair protein [Enterococcus faecium]EGP5088616.1 DNA repair protein [Enterococcus faecium]EGP5128533.1 DNA repair protein [Enterococcus faecium]EGP5140169.1 DNA repair protein [Enterococcus faecium]